MQAAFKEIRTAIIPRRNKTFTAEMGEWISKWYPTKWEYHKLNMAVHTLTEATSVAVGPQELSLANSQRFEGISQDEAAGFVLASEAVCSIPNCLNEMQGSKAYCPMHTRRIENNGSPYITQVKRGYGQAFKKGEVTIPDFLKPPVHIRQKKRKKG